MKTLFIKGTGLVNSAKRKFLNFNTVRSGEGYLDVLIKILITVILGAALLGLLQAAIPELFQDIVEKIKSVFTI